MARKKKIDVEKEIIKTEEPKETVIVNDEPINVTGVGTLVDDNVSLQRNNIVTNTTDTNNFLQTIYDLGYYDGSRGVNKRELRIDKETGRLKF